MNNYQSNKQRMYMTVRDFLLKNISVVQKLPNAEALQEELQQNMEQIEIATQQQLADTTGYRKVKEELRAKLKEEVNLCSRKLTAFAIQAKNTLLRQEVDYSDSKLQRLTETELAAVAQIVLNRAATNLDQLPAYGITAESQATLQKAIDDYNASIPTPKLGITERKKATEQLNSLFESSDTIIETIDVLVDTLKVSDPGFYTGYHTARKISDFGRTSLSVRATVTDAATGKPAKGVTVTFAPDGENDGGKVALTKKTSDLGGFTDKTLMPGTYIVTATKPGYKAQALRAIVNSGELCELTIAMEKE